MRRNIFPSLMVVALVGLLATGCATERQSQYTTTGAGIGAITGGILGGVLGSMSGKAGEGVVIGSILGGLAGASVGNEEYHRDRSEEVAAQQYAYNRERASRDLVRIEGSKVEPKVAHPGEELRLATTYTMLNRWGGEANVHEVREIRHEGRLIGRPEINSTRDAGTWTTSVPLMLPADAEYGTYVVTTIIETDSAGDSRETTFRVEPSSSWRR